MSLLLGTDPSRSKLKQLLETYSQGVILTAFFSEAAEKWFNAFKLECCTFVIRGKVTDFMSGASSIVALQKLIENGHSVKLKLDLHAKLFWFGDEMLLGSSNLTGNGFNLIDHGGNIELNSVVPANDDNVKVVQNIVSSSSSIDAKILLKMEKHILEKSSGNSTEVLDWPAGFLDFPTSNLTVWNLPQLDLQRSAEHDLEIWGDIARSYRSGNLNQSTEMLERTKVFNWLILNLRNKGDRGLNFGAISSLLHDELVADPALFRSEVKELQRCLYSFLKAVPSQIEYSVPGARSEVLKLK